MPVNQITLTGLQDNVYETAKSLKSLGYLVHLTMNNTLICGRVNTVEYPFDHPIAWLSPIDGENPERISTFVNDMKAILERHHEAK